MKEKLTVFLITLLIVGQSFAAEIPDNYTFIVDLTAVENDRLKVVLFTPVITESEITYFLPKIIPGTYRISNYGRFISELKAFDQKGIELKINRVDENSWKISNSDKMVKLTYWVEDIIDSHIKGPDIWPMATTNIESEKNFIINTPGFFGYFDGKKNLPIKLKIIRSENLFGSTVLDLDDNTLTPKDNEIVGTTKELDSYTIENYDRLIDSPLMYSEPDTVVIKVANTEVLISAYSPNKIISAKEISATIEKVLFSQNKYLGGTLPVDKYAFIFYFTDHHIPVFGGLEHSYSSFYYIPENSIQKFQEDLKGFAAHEFFHIVLPLNIHSEEIQFFDFHNPKMSKHLWLYEGVTEYFADNMQVKYDLISEDQYLQIIRHKMVAASNYNDTVAFTEISKYSIDKYSDQYLNVYEKGALIGMCLDILLRDLSDGSYGTQNLIADLSKKYGKKQAFKDDELFSVITAMTYPEVGEFLNKYVSGNSQLPFVEILNKVGVSHVSIKDGWGGISDVSPQMLDNTEKINPRLYKLVFDEHASERQLKIRKSWLKP